MASSNKRQRQLARAKEQRRLARMEQLARKRRRQRIIAAAVVVGMVAAGASGLFAASLLRDNGSSSAAQGEQPAASGPQPVASCRPPGELTDATMSYEAPGDARLGDSTEPEFTLTTNCGDITIAADAAAAPQTVRSMAFLAAEGYFNSTLCHRLTTEGIFVLQCGDPTGTGTGGPGYSVPDENLPTAGTNNYPAGTVAMANAGPGTAGSQFFIVYRDTTLPPNYTIWGRVTQGLDIVEQVARAGTTNGSSDGAPQQGVMIETVTVAS